MTRMKLAATPILMGLLGLTLMTSRALAQVSWQTTHTTIGGYNSGICVLNHASVNIKVFPAYLDVEEDAEIAPTGQVSRGNDAKTLEITGNFSLPEGAVITGALLWDGSQILQGKLLDRVTADSLYNSLIERNSKPPVRPRDPLILEAMSKNNYRFRIYPCVPGMNRHFRLRYQLAPVLGAQGLEIPFQAAIAPLFPASSLSIPVTIENGGNIPKILFVSSGGIRTSMELPKTKLMTPATLGLGYGGYDSYGNYHSNVSIKILPIDPLRQVAVKTSFSGGAMAGEYLNLYAGVTNEVLSGLHQKIEVVIYWKWHNPGTWIEHTDYGDYPSGYVYQAQNQAWVLNDLYNQFGGVGNKIGLLHDDSRLKPKAFAVASRGEPSYAQAQEYLHSIVNQPNYVEEFARGIKVLRNSTNQPLSASINISKNRFITNLRLIKTLYSPDSGIVRHLLVISAGDDYLTDNSDLNQALDTLFAGTPISLALVAGYGFSQAGFDFFDAKRSHTYSGISIPTQWGKLPGLPELNLNVTVQNAKKAYDFDISCAGGLDISCGSLTFHAKSNEKWNDTLVWQAFDKNGKLVGQTKSLPKIIEHSEDTAIALLWAGSESPFSEKKELPLGPIYGFVDKWASLLSLPKDSLPSASAAAYADTGVPHLANNSLKNIIPNYVDGSAATLPPGSGNPGTCGTCWTTSLASKLGELSNPAAWRFERGLGNSLLIHIPGLASGVDVNLEIFDLEGKRMGTWSMRSQAGLLTVDASQLKSGMYLLKIRVREVEGIKHLAF